MALAYDMVDVMATFLNFPRRRNAIHNDNYRDIPQLF
jgi:hypothetical protein